MLWLRFVDGLRHGHVRSTKCRHPHANVLETLEGGGGGKDVRGVTKHPQRVGGGHASESAHRTEVKWKD